MPGIWALLASAERTRCVTASFLKTASIKTWLGLAEEQLTGSSSTVSDSHAADAKMAALAWKNKIANRLSASHLLFGFIRALGNHYNFPNCLTASWHNKWRITMCLILTGICLNFILDYCSGNSGRQPRAPITGRVSFSYHRSNYKPESGLSKNGSLAMLICGLKLAPTSVRAALTPPSVNTHTHIQTQTIPTFHNLQLVSHSSEDPSFLLSSLWPVIMGFKFPYLLTCPRHWDIFGTACA